MAGSPNLYHAVCTIASARCGTRWSSAHRLSSAARRLFQKYQETHSNQRFD